MERATELIQTPVITPSQRWRIRLRTLVEVGLPPTVFFVVIVTFWQLYVTVQEIPAIIMPKPSAILARLLADPYYFFVENGMVTFSEALSGFAFGAIAALIVAVFLARSRVLERSIFPLAVIIRATPLIVIAPLLIIWFGYSIYPKIIMAALLCFFPILVNTIVGLRSVSSTSLEFFHSVAASEWEILTKLRVPHALPYVLSAFKTAVTLAVIGAVVAEWSGAGEGLGRLIFWKAALLDQVSVFAAIVVLAIMGVTLTAIVGWLEKLLLFWHESSLVG
ncbi:MAG: ABC transporter permease [Anaerolineales bacterium]